MADNISRETATLITIPADITLDVSNVVDARKTVWFKYVAPPGVTHLALFPYAVLAESGNYRPKSFGIYENESLTHYLNFNPETNRTTYNAYMIPLTSGNTYYIMIRDSIEAGALVTCILHLKAINAPIAAYADGSILINDDTFGYNIGVILNSVNGIFITGVPFVPGEYADILDSGIILTESLTATGQGELQLYNADLTWNKEVLGAHPEKHVFARIKAVGTNFYVLECGFLTDDYGRTIRRVSNTGVVSPTTWTLPIHGEDSGIRIFAISPDETIAYYDYFDWNINRYVIARHDLINDLPLTDLIILADGTQPATGNGNHITEAFTLPDGSLIFATESPLQLLRYSAAGALLNTYVHADRINRIARGRNNDTIWVWEGALAPYTDIRIKEYNAATGAVVTDFAVPLNNKGISLYTNPDAATEPQLSASSSCPIIILRTGGEAPIIPIVGGIYFINPNKVTKHDSYYNDIEKKIPNPTVRTGLFGA